MMCPSPGADAFPYVFLKRAPDTTLRVQLWRLGAACRTTSHDIARMCRTPAIGDVTAIVSPMCIKLQMHITRCREGGAWMEVAIKTFYHDGDDDENHDPAKKRAVHMLCDTRVARALRPRIGDPPAA